jgi:hypothetical protein
MGKPARVGIITFCSDMLNQNRVECSNKGCPSNPNRQLLRSNHT